MPEDHCHSRGFADHTLHFHALFTSSLALSYAFTSAGHKRAGINEWQKSNIYASPGTPKTGHMIGALQRQLPAQCPPEGGTISSVRERRRSEDCVCCRRKYCWGWLGFHSIYSRVPAVLIQDLLFCLCTEKYQILISLNTKLTRRSL